MKYIEYILAIGFGFVMLDIIGAMMWVFSGQYAVSNWYLGKLTLDIIRLILG